MFLSYNNQIVFLITVVISFLTQTSVFAFDLELDNKLGKTSQTSSLSISGDAINIKKTKSSLNLAAEVGYATDQATDSTNGTTYTDKNTSGTFTATGTLRRSTELSLGLMLSKTPEEGLTNNQINMSLGYTHFFKSSKAKEPKETPDDTITEGESKNEDNIKSNDSTAKESAKGKKSEEDSDEEAFEPRLGLSAEIDLGRFVQDLSTRSRALKNVSVKTTDEIAQSNFALNLKWKPWEWVKVTLLSNNYKYDKDVTTFLARLDNRASANRLMGAMGSTVSSLPRSEVGGKINFYFPAGWESQIKYTVATAASDGSISNVTLGQISKEFGEHVMVTLGLEQDYSPTAFDQLAIINLSLEDL